MSVELGDGPAKRDRLGFTAGVADEAVVGPDVELIGIDRLSRGS